MKCPFCKSLLYETFEGLELTEILACLKCLYGKNRFNKFGKLIDFSEEKYDKTYSIDYTN